MDRWQSMRVFVKVAETGGFAEAARQMNLSAPAVTRAVAGLEKVVGARLLLRTTRSVHLTDAGCRYFEDCQRILAEIAEAEASAAGTYATPTGTLAVTASVLFGQIHVLPVVTAYLDAYPAMTARMLFADRQVNLLDEGIDVAVRIGHLPDSGFTAVRVGTVRRVVCGAPAYFERYGVPTTPQDLRGHRIAASTSAWSSREWRFADGERVTVNPLLQSNVNEPVIETALAGWAVTRVLNYQIGPALLDGRLQIVLADFEEPPLPVHLIYAEGRQAPAKVRAFVDMAVAALRRNTLLN